MTAQGQKSPATIWLKAKRFLNFHTAPSRREDVIAILVPTFVGQIIIIVTVINTSELDWLERH